jgi:Raf kinase inhibitor-like YbhB/YbcL family protein
LIAGFVVIVAGMRPILLALALLSSAIPLGAAQGGTAMQLTSPAFAANAEIPQQFTCEGENKAPPLAWTGAPAGAKSLALIVDDPDAPDPKAPKTVWVHWVVYNLPAAAAGELPEGGKLPPGATVGTNDFKKAAWGGPCPPVGRHRYFFKLHALDTVLPDLGHPTKAALEKAMAGHVLAKAELVGSYQKKKH